MHKRKLTNGQIVNEEVDKKRRRVSGHIEAEELPAPILALPEELLWMVFSLLDLDDLVSAGMVCTQWHRIHLSDTLWHSFYLAHIGGDCKILTTSPPSFTHLASSSVIPEVLNEKTWRGLYLKVPLLGAEYPRYLSAGALEGLLAGIQIPPMEVEARNVFLQAAEEYLMEAFRGAQEIARLREGEERREVSSEEGKVEDIVSAEHLRTWIASKNRMQEVTDEIPYLGENDETDWLEEPVRDEDDDWTALQKIFRQWKNRSCYEKLRQRPTIMKMRDPITGETALHLAMKFLPQLDWSKVYDFLRFFVWQFAFAIKGPDESEAEARKRVFDVRDRRGRTPIMCLPAHQWDIRWWTNRCEWLFDELCRSEGVVPHVEATDRLGYTVFEHCIPTIYSALSNPRHATISLRQHVDGLSWETKARIAYQVLQSEKEEYFNWDLLQHLFGTFEDDDHPELQFKVLAWKNLKDEGKTLLHLAIECFSFEFERPAVYNKVSRDESIFTKLICLGANVIT